MLPEPAYRILQPRRANDNEHLGAPEGGSGSGVTAGESYEERSESELSPAVTPRGRAGGVATKLSVVKTPRPTDEGAIFAPAKIVTESLSARPWFVVILILWLLVFRCIVVGSKAIARLQAIALHWYVREPPRGAAGAGKGCLFSLRAQRDCEKRQPFPARAGGGSSDKIVRCQNFICSLQKTFA